MKLTGGGRLSLSTAGMLVSTCLLFALPAFADDSSLPGQWENDDSTLRIVYLADGRVVKVDERPGVVTPIRVDMGTYTFDDTAIMYTWMLEGSEKSSVIIGTDTMTDEIGRSMSRTATAEDVQAAYDETVAGMQKTADVARKDIPTTSASGKSIFKILIKGPLPDKHMADVFPHAVLYQQVATYQWSPPGSTPWTGGTLDHTVYNLTLFPNGRYYFDGYLYGSMVDGSVPFDPKSKVVVTNSAKVTVRQQRYWGKYRVTAGKGSLDPDHVDLVADSGTKSSVDIVDGRLYLIWPSPRLLFADSVRVSKYNQQSLKR